MVYCDRNDRILEWGSEEFFIPYRSPLDGKIHRYFPDFYVKVKTKQNTIKKWVVEVKPKAQTRPPRTPKRKTKNILQKSVTMQSMMQSGKMLLSIVKIEIWNLLS